VPADIEDPIGPRAPVDDEHPGVVRQRRLLRARGRPIGGRAGLRRHFHLVEQEAAALRFQFEAEGEAVAVRAAGEGLLLQDLPPLVGQPRDDRLSAKAGRRHIRLHRNRRILEGRLGHAHLLQGDIDDRILPADDHRVHRRQPGQVGGRVPKVGGSAVGQQQNAGQGAALKAVREGVQSAREDRGAAVEGELVKVRGGLQPRIEDIALHVEGVREGGQPLGPGGIDQGSQGLPARLSRSPVPDLQALAVVREHGKQVGAGPSALAEPKRLEQTEPQGGERRRL